MLLQRCVINLLLLYKRKIVTSCRFKLISIISTRNYIQCTFHIHTSINIWNNPYWRLFIKIHVRLPSHNAKLHLDLQSRYSYFTNCAYKRKIGKSRFRVAHIYTCPASKINAIDARALESPYTQISKHSQGLLLLLRLAPLPSVMSYFWRKCSVTRRRENLCNIL